MAKRRLPLISWRVNWKCSKRSRYAKEDFTVKTYLPGTIPTIRKKTPRFFSQQAIWH